MTGGVEQLDCGSCRQLRRGACGGHGLERAGGGEPSPLSARCFSDGREERSRGWRVQAAGAGEGGLSGGRNLTVTRT